MDEESLTRSARAFVAQFEPMIVAIHTMVVEIRLGAFDEARAQRVIAVGAEALTAANSLIVAYLGIRSSNRELQDLFVQLLVSLQPRLAGELEELRAALESDPEPPDIDILDRDPASAPPGVNLIGELAAERDRLGRAIQTGKLDGFLPSSSSDEDVPPAASSGDQDDPLSSAGEGDGGTARVDAASGCEDDRAQTEGGGGPEEAEVGQDGET
jgi:hypothetical protein